MRRFFLTSVTIDISCLVYSNFCMKKLYLKTVSDRLRSLGIFISCKNYSKLGIKYSSSPKSTKIDAFGQELLFYDNFSYKSDSVYIYIYNIYVYICIYQSGYTVPVLKNGISCTMKRFLCYTEQSKLLM